MSGFLEGLELRSLIKADGTLELSLRRVEVADPAPAEVIVEVQATPINPSDVGLMIGAADMGGARGQGTGEGRVLTAVVPDALMPTMSKRIGQSLTVGNEGAGLVVKAGAAPEAQALLGKIVAMFGGGMYTRYRNIRASECMVLPPEATAADGASCFINPLTALAMVETMRAEGHTGLVHTAAASNLGQMLSRICLRDRIPLVNIVRSADQVRVLQASEATHVLVSTDADFIPKLVTALDETGATLVFDAIGGGALGGQILAAIEAAASAKADGYSRYGSSKYKQLYIYGGLDLSATVLNRGGFGLAWGVGGFLLTSFLQKAGPEVSARMRQRVVTELQTTFASHYSHTISLEDILTPAVAVAYARKATGEKYLIDPRRELN